MRKFYLQYISGLLLIFSVTISAHEFTIIATGDEKSPSAEDCKRMGVAMLWFGSGLPQDGVPEKPEKIESIFKRFENTDIPIILNMNAFYGKYPDKGQIIRFSDKPAYRCFSQDNTDITERAASFTKWLSKFKNFKGLCGDDEPGIQPGGCVCKHCTELFKKEYGLNPPSNEDYLNAAKGIVAENNTVLLWAKFQNDQILKYYASITDTIKKEKPDARVLNIPAAAYFSGKQLSIPDCKPEDFVKSGRRVTLDNCHIRDFQLYIQFYMNEINSSGWKNKIADGLCLYMEKKGLPQFPNIPIHDKFDPSAKPVVISVPAFKRFIVQTFSEGGKGIVYFPGRSLSPEHVAAAEKAYNEFIKPVCKNAPQLHKMPGKVGILYSTTTRTFSDLWINNPIERYKHLHECDALAYYLFKKAIPFEMIMEDEIKSSDDLKRFPVIISAGLDFISAKKAKILEEYIKDGGKLVVDKNSAVNIPGTTALDFDAESWYRAVTGGNQRASDMEYQAGLIDKDLSLELKDLPVICKTQDRRLNINYLTDGKDVYLFLVNDDLNTAAESSLTFDKAYEVSDIIENKNIAKTDKIKISVNPAELKVLKLEQ